MLVVLLHRTTPQRILAARGHLDEGQPVGESAAGRLIFHPDSW
jgi:hypothetical protein